MSRGCSAGHSDTFVMQVRPGVPGRRRLAERAAAWLLAHLTEPLSIGDLCKALGVRERTLHAAFCEHTGSSPKAYFKNLRLRAARNELRHAARDTRVTDVALHWGFLHFSWFAHDYRRHFGETPSTTLRQAVSRSARPREAAERARSSHNAA